MVRSVGSGTITAAAGNGSDSSSAIAALQKRLVGLMKELRDVSQDTTPGAKEKLKLLQIQIQAVEMQIQQLQALDAQKAALEQLKRQQEPETANSASDSDRTKSRNSTLGLVVDNSA